MESFLDNIWLAIGDLEPLGEDFGEKEASTLRVSSFMVQASGAASHCPAGSDAPRPDARRDLTAARTTGLIVFNYFIAVVRFWLR